MTSMAMITIPKANLDQESHYNFYFMLERLKETAYSNFFRVRWSSRPFHGKVKRKNAKRTSLALNQNLIQRFYPVGH